MIETAKKLRQHLPVEARASSRACPEQSQRAQAKLGPPSPPSPNPVILSGAGSSAKRMIQRSRRTPTLFEVGQVLRRLVREGAVSAQRADQAIEDLLDLRIARYPHFLLLPRIWQLRHNLSAYAAAYVALAESLGARLLTRDARLASVSGLTATIELF